MLNKKLEYVVEAFSEDQLDCDITTLEGVATAIQESIEKSNELNNPV